ncbi:hypothetical protein [Aquabacterium sp.]|uniref:hypothetical protein n=1 Tax=Aquabacterium sp. TaxID=1872578 RepID=UPI0035ADA27C
MSAALVAYSLSGCQAALQHNGVGTTSDEEIIKATAYQYGVDPSKVALTDAVQRKTLPSGQEILYNVKISGKAYRCYMKTILFGHDKPVCAKPGEPLNIPSNR